MELEDSIVHESIEDLRLDYMSHIQPSSELAYEYPVEDDMSVIPASPNAIPKDLIEDRLDCLYYIPESNLKEFGKDDAWIKVMMNLEKGVRLVSCQLNELSKKGARAEGGKMGCNWRELSW